MIIFLLGLELHNWNAQTGNFLCPGASVLLEPNKKFNPSKPVWMLPLYVHHFYLDETQLDSLNISLGHFPYCRYVKRNLCLHIFILLLNRIYKVNRSFPEVFCPPNNWHFVGKVFHYHLTIMLLQTDIENEWPFLIGLNSGAKEK